MHYRNTNLLNLILSYEQNLQNLLVIPDWLIFTPLLIVHNNAHQTIDFCLQRKFSTNNIFLHINNYRYKNSIGTLLSAVSIIQCRGSSMTFSTENQMDLQHWQGQNWWTTILITKINNIYLFHVYIQTETFYLICNMFSETMLILTTIPITQITNNTKTKTISSKSTDPEYDFCF